MAKDPYRYFRVEARELMDQLSKGVLELEKESASTDLVLRLLRLAHTLKGAARVVKQASIADLIHGVEDSLTPFRDTVAAVPRDRVDQVLAALDSINLQLEHLAIVPDGETAAIASASTLPHESVRVARADIVEIDIVLEGLGEIGSALTSVRATVDDLKALRALVGQLREQIDASNVRARTLADRAHTVTAIAERNLAASSECIDREVRQARDVTQKLRLVPAASIFHALERTARDAAHAVGKQVTFEATGGDVRIDAEVLDVVQNALVQLVRNAVAHGIERPPQRQAVGKPPAGRISLDVTRQGYCAQFRCRDDGRGVDLEAVRRALQQKGTPAEQTQAMSAAQLMAQLLRGGISTADTVTELAGRGVGLDVVREAAQRLNGDLAATSDAGTGTMVDMRVPLSLTSLNVLFVEADAQIVAIPLDAVQRTLRVAARDIVHTPQGTAIANQGALIPLLPLALGGPSRRAPASLQTAVIVQAAGKTVALGVTRLCGIDSVVLRPLPAWVPAQPLVLGLHLDTDGNPRIVVDPQHCVGLQAAVDDDIAPVRSTSPILIIDDSLTTRMLESSILESAGFAVEMASSAEEGLSMAQQRQYALFLVDVEMPGMDGFGFVEQTRADPVLRNVPCILVTSRDAPEDRRRGLAVGARAYIVKGEFDQVEFLQQVAELVAR